MSAREFKLGAAVHALNEAAERYADAPADRGRRAALCKAALRFGDALKEHRRLNPRRVAKKGECEVCHKPVDQPATGRPRKYCSKTCYRLRRQHPTIVRDTPVSAVARRGSK